MSRAQLIRAATALGDEHRERTDQVLADGADEDALRAILAAAVEPDRYETMDLAQLSREAVGLTDHSAEVDAAFAAPDPLPALRTVLRTAAAAVEGSAGSGPLDTAGDTERELSDSPVGEPKEDAPPDVEEDHLRNLRATMLQELERAAAAASPAARQAHEQTAEMLRIKLKAGATRSPSAKRSPRKNKGPTRLDFSQRALEQALEANDTVRVNKLLDSRQLDLSEGQSKTMRDLQLAASFDDQQGVYTPWTDRPLVTPPGASFEGRRPVVDLSTTAKKNIVLPRWLHVPDDVMDSDMLAAPSGTGLEERADGRTTTNAAIADISTPSALLKSKVLVQQYCMATTPPLMSLAQAATHLAYCIESDEELILQGGSYSSEVVNIFVRLDEKIRIHIASASEELAFDDYFPRIMAEYKEKPLLALARRQRASSESGETGTGTKARKKREKAERDRAGRRDTQKKKTAEQVLLDLSSKVDIKWVKKSNRYGCADYNQPKGCKRTRCGFSHHCLICGDSDHGMDDHV